MGVTKSLLRGIVACIAAILVARTLGSDGAKIGLLTGGSVAAATWLSGRDDGTDVEFEAESTTE